MLLLSCRTSGGGGNERRGSTGRFAGNGWSSRSGVCESHEHMLPHASVFPEVQAAGWRPHAPAFRHKKVNDLCIQSCTTLFVLFLLTPPTFSQLPLLLLALHSLHAFLRFLLLHCGLLYLFDLPCDLLTYLMNHRRLSSQPYRWCF